MPEAQRADVEREVNQEPQKPIQQLVCHIHEELMHSREPEATKRLASMMGRVAVEHERNSIALKWLTWAIMLLTAALVFLAVYR